MVSDMGHRSKQYVDWILRRQSRDGSWADFLTAFQFSVHALLLEGFDLKDPPIRRALAAIYTGNGWTRMASLYKNLTDQAGIRP